MKAKTDTYCRGTSHRGLSQRNGTFWHSLQWDCPWRSEIECPQNAPFEKLLYFRRSQKLDCALRSSTILVFNRHFSTYYRKFFHSRRLSRLCSEIPEDYYYSSMRIDFRMHAKLNENGSRFNSYHVCEDAHADFLQFYCVSVEHSLAPPVTKVSASKFTRCEQNSIFRRWPRTTRDMIVASAAAADVLRHVICIA